MPAPNLSARERILTTAHDLFYRDGLRATGIDRIISESGVAKLTFYRHFSSKDVLIETFLAYRHQRWMAWFIDALGRHGATLGGGLWPLVATMGEWFEDPSFRGCAFINVAAEIGASSPAALHICQRHKRDMLDTIAALVPEGPAQAGIASAAAVAVDGAIVRAQMANNASALESLSQLLSALMQTPSPLRASP